MVNRSRAFVLAVCAAALTSPSASAAAGEGIPTRDLLPLDCAQQGASNESAFACDLGTSGVRGARIALGSDAFTATARWDQLGVGGFEPLLPGERLVLDWPRPSARGLLSLRVRSPRGAYTTVLELGWRPRHVEVTVLADGALSVQTAARSGIVPVPRWLAPIEWRPRSARAAAEQILSAVDRFSRSITAMQTICAALDPEVAPRYFEPGEDKDACLIALFWFGDENVPHVRTSRHEGLSLRISGARAVFRTRLSHVFRRDAGPPRVSLTVRALLARDAQGIWRLATPVPLLPNSAVFSPTTFTDRRLAADYRDELASGRRWARSHARRRAAEAAAAVTASATPPCTVATAPDPAGDVVVERSEQVTRRPGEHLDVDITEAGRSATCIALHTRAPLPAAFEVAAGAFTIVVREGRVFIEQGDDALVRVIGASLTADTLVVALPRGLETSCGIELAADVEGVDYGDRSACPADSRQT